MGSEAWFGVKAFQSQITFRAERLAIYRCVKMEGKRDGQRFRMTVSVPIEEPDVSIY